MRQWGGGRHGHLFCSPGVVLKSLLCLPLGRLLCNDHPFEACNCSSHKHVTRCWSRDALMKTKERSRWSARRGRNVTAMEPFSRVTYRKTRGSNPSSA